MSNVFDKKKIEMERDRILQENAFFTSGRYTPPSPSPRSHWNLHFILGAIFATVVVGTCWLAPFFLLNVYIHPTPGWQRIVFLLLISIPFLVWTAVCTLFWIWIASKFE